MRPYIWPWSRAPLEPDYIPLAMSDKDELSKSTTVEAKALEVDEAYAGALGDVKHTAKIIDRAMEMRICRKLDFCILPVLAIMYLFNSIDKGNLGNAKTDGMDVDLGFVGNQYNDLLSLFFIPYVVFAFPITLAGKAYGPSRVLPLLMFIFGVMTLLSAAAQNFAGMMTLRWFLGMAEGAFFPLVIYYLTTFYRRGELARRLAIFYAASNIANAFSGLLAFGVFQIQNSSIYPWRYLFIIEGAASVVWSVFAFFVLPYSPARAKFLNEEERELAFLRIQHDSSAIVGEKLSVRDSLRVLKHPVAWVWIWIDLCLGVPLQSVSLFLPQIVARLGYDTVKTNLYTVAPNVVGAVMLLILAFASDLTKIRFPYIALGFCFPLVGFIIYATIDVLHNLQVAYFATFLMCMGTSAPSVILSTWYNNNTPSEGRRSALTSIAVPIANLMGVVSSNIFLPQDAPAYIPALGTTAAFGGVGLLSTLLLGFWMVFDNRRRDREQGVKLKVEDVSTEVLHEGPSHPSFRWIV